MYTQSKLINKNILRAGIPKGIPKQNNLPHVHSVKTNKKKYFESRNTKGYKQNNLPHVHSVKTNKQKYFESRNTNRITFLMYTQSKLINKNILRAGIGKLLMYTQSKLINKNILRAGIQRVSTE